MMNCNQLEEYIVKNCKELKSLTLPTSLKKLDISYCDKLADIYQLNATHCEQISIVYCASLDTLSVPSTLTSLTITKCYLLSIPKDIFIQCQQSKQNHCVIIK